MKTIVFAAIAIACLTGCSSQQTAKSAPAAESGIDALSTQGGYEVGNEIPPGTYRSQAGQKACASRVTPKVGDARLSQGENIEVTLLPSDANWSHRGCGRWERLEK